MFSLTPSKTAGKLEARLKGYKTPPQPTEKALENLRRLKSEVGMKDSKTDRGELRAILRKADPLSDEILEHRKKERK
jgi:hypothetical protein